MIIIVVQACWRCRNFYIVPGGRLAKPIIGTYFTMLGLAESGREDLLKWRYFARMIENYTIFNGNRTYYLEPPGKSPVFAPMVELFGRRWRVQARGVSTISKWNTPSGWTAPNRWRSTSFHRHVVRMPDVPAEPLLGRSRHAARDESSLEDVETVKHSWSSAHLADFVRLGLFFHAGYARCGPVSASIRTT